MRGQGTFNQIVWSECLKGYLRVYDCNCEKKHSNLNTKRIFYQKKQSSTLFNTPKIACEKLSQLPNLNGEDTEIGLRAALADLIEATRESP